MKFASTLAARNMRRRPVRTAAMILLAAFLAFSILAGSLIVASLQNGLKSYEDRLGADVVVVPYEARTHGQFESILLQGIPGMFSMSTKDYQKVIEREGIEVAAPQFFLTSASASCCSVSVQIIGFDPELDFTVQPWIRESYEDKLETGDVIVGADLNLPTDREVQFFNTRCKAVAQMEKTGTGLDTAVYCTMDTIELIIKNAQKLGFKAFDDVDPATAVSAVMIKVADGYTPEQVTGDINIHVKRVQAGQAANMFSGIADGLSSVSGIIRILIVMIWILAIVVLAITFAMIAHERAKEFAVLRVIGASRNMLSRLLLTESIAISAIGSVCGAAAAALAILPFSSLISAKLQLPYLMPDAGTIVLFTVGSLLVSILAGSLTAAFSAYRVSRQDAAFTLREGV